MGNLIGLELSTALDEEAALIDAIWPFDNLSIADIEMFWIQFYDIASGFALSQSEFCTICSSAAYALDRNPEKYNKYADILFQVYATNVSKNDPPSPVLYMDALEFLSGMVFISTSSFQTKIELLFDSWDMSEDGGLDIDEFTISLKSTILGLHKILQSNVNKKAPLPSEDDIIIVADKIFHEILKIPFTAQLDKNASMTCDHFRQYCMNNTEAVQLFDIFDNAAADDYYSDLETEGIVKERTVKETIQMDPEAAIEHNEFQVDHGDEFLAVKPWEGAIVPPSNPPKADTSIPPISLKLQWVYGYSAQDARNNLKYLKTGEIVFPAAAVGVVQNPVQNAQGHHLAHTDDILAMGLHPLKELVATGEIGKTPKIIIWNSSTLETCCTLRGYHKKGISQLEFSVNGARLVSIGADEEHCVGVYQSTDQRWSGAELKWFSKGNKSVSLDLKCHLADQTLFVCCGMKYIDFWTVKGNSVVSKKGIFGKNNTMQPFLVAEYMKDQLFVGASSGDIYTFKDGTCQAMTKAHKDAVNAMNRCDSKLVTGGKDGQIIVWDSSLQIVVGPFEMTKVLNMQIVVIRSVCLSNDAQKILFGTLKSQIYEIQTASGSLTGSGSLLNGHFDGELWGLSAHPSKLECCTVGDDKTLRVWDLTSRRQIRSISFESSARACAYSPEGKFIAVGFGASNDVGPKGGGKVPKISPGMVHIYDEKTLTKLFEKNDAKNWISDIKFSLCGKYLAIGSHDTHVVIYDTARSFMKKHIFKKHNSYITRLDFSMDGNYIQSTSGSYELLFCDTKTGNHITSASMLKDENWASWTVPLGWPVQGIWPPCSDGTDINCVARSHNGRFVATGDDFGKVKVFRYPCTVKHASSIEYVGHSSHITNVVWTMKDTCLLSVGGNDRCLMQWSNDNIPTDKNVSTVGSSDLNTNGKRKNSLSNDSMLDLEEHGGGDEFLAVKPWIGAIVAPTIIPPVSDSTPTSTLELEWVHGYQAQNSLNNVRYTPLGFVVYHAAALGVVYDIAKSKQYYFDGHDDDISCLAIHPNGVYVATGQMGKKPKIFVWEISKDGSTHTISSIQGFHARSIVALSFSSDGEKLGSVGADNDHSVAIYKWKDSAIIASCKGDKGKVSSIVYNDNTKEWITCGDKHIKFWSEQGRNVGCKKAILGKKGSLQYFHSVFMHNKTCAVCTESGDLYIFDGYELKTVVSVSTKSALYAIYSDGNQECVVGGKDGVISILDNAFKVSTQFKLAEIIPGCLNASIRSLSWNSKRTHLLVGTLGSCIYQVDRHSRKCTTIVQGHFKNELWGLASHPLRAEYCSVGDDSTLRVWDIETKMQWKAMKLPCLARACAYSPNGELIAVGFGGRIVGSKKHAKEGAFVLINNKGKELAITCEEKPSKECVSEIKFTPDGSRVVVGSHDVAIYIYNVVSETKCVQKAVFRSHSSYITHFDFSNDGKYMQSNCGAYELLFADVESGRQRTQAKALRDVKWHTWTCTLGWPVQGIWPPASDGTDINAVDRSKDESLLVTGDDFGSVKMFTYPCVSKNAHSTSYKGHSSHVTNVRWTVKDSHVISAGGLDRCLMQWRHTSQRDKHSSLAIPGAGGGTSSTAAEADNDYHDSGEVKTKALRDSVEFNSLDAGDEFLAVKPWAAAIVAPSNPPKDNPREPDVKLKLEWVYGYQTEIARQNLFYNANGHILYHSAAVGIIFDRTTNLQRHHTGHSNDITALTVSSSGRFAATGEIGKKPVIRVWDAITGNLLSECKNFHSRGIVSLAFSPDEKYLASIGNDDDHSLAIYEDKGGAWSNSALMVSSKADKNVNYCLHFISNTLILSGGAKHALFYTIKGKSITLNKGKFGNYTFQGIQCATHCNDLVLTGTESGELYLWQKDTVQKSVKAHDGACNTLYSTATVFLSGGKDGKICIWNGSLQQTGCFNIDASCILKSIHSLCISPNGEKILVSTRASDIYELDMQSGAVVKTKAVFSGHFAGELWGLSMHPMLKHCCTVGDDQTVRVWDLQEKAIVLCNKLMTKTRTCSYSWDGAMIVVGLGGEGGTRRASGKAKPNGGKKAANSGLVILNAKDLSIIFEDYSVGGNKFMSDCKFSPCNRYVAVGCHDTHIYLYARSDSGASFQLKHKFTKHRSYITHFDFDKSSSYLQSNCGGYELLYMDVKSGKHITSPSAMKDVQWQSWTCVLGWPVQGIWPECADGTDINAVCASNNRNLLVTGDDSSTIKVFRYPCITKGAKFILGQGHSSHVTNVRFGIDDQYFISVGGLDRSVFQWKLSS